MNYDYQTLLMQKSYQHYLEEQLAQCTCSLAMQQQNALMQQQTQRILSESDYNYFPASLLSLNEIYQQIIYPYKLTTECCCENRTKPKKTNCVNCGAPLRGQHRCIYCDTYNE